MILTHLVIILLAGLFGTAKVAANDCQFAKTAWPQLFGSIDPVSCCIQNEYFSYVEGLNCLKTTTSFDSQCLVLCKNGSITDINVFYEGANKAKAPTSGPFPDLSSLTQLTFLRLSTNLIGISTNFPPALQHLDLDDSTLTGAFPSFNQATALQSLSIDSSNLSGPLPTLPNTVTYLELNSNKLLTDVPSLPLNLITLNLNASGSGRMSSLKSLTRLTEIHITDCNFSGDFPLLPDSLTVLEVAHTNFTGSFPVLPRSLQSVMLDDIPLTGSFPTLPNSLGSLSIRYVPQLSGSLPALARMSVLNIIDIYGTKMSGSIPMLPSSINSLTLDDNSFTGPLPSLPQGLTQLFVSNNQLTGSIPSLPSSLIELGLKNNHFNGTIPTLPSLLYLDLSNNQLTGTIPSSITRTGVFLPKIVVPSFLPQVPITPVSPGSQISGSIPAGSGLQTPSPVPVGSGPGSISPGPGPGPIPVPVPIFLEPYFIQLDGNCFTNAAALNVTNVCPSADIIASGNTISALSDSEYVDKAKAYKLTTVPDCLNPCRNKIPGYSTFDSNTAALNVTCLEVDTNPNSLQPFLDCASKILDCNDGLGADPEETGSQKAAVFVQLLNNLCKQYVQPSPVVSVSNRTVSFSFNHQDTTLFGFQAFASTVNGTFVAGSKFDISKPLKVPASAFKKRDNLDTQTISLPCDMKAAVLHTKYVVDDPSILISDLDKLGHFKQVDLDLTDSGSGCQGDAVPIVTTAAASPIKTAMVPIATTAIVIPPPTTTENIAPQVVTTAAFIPPITTTIPAPILNPANEGSGAVNNAGNNGGSSGNMGGGVVNSDGTTGATGTTGESPAAGIIDKPSTSMVLPTQQTLAPSPNTGFSQVSNAKSQTIIASALSISASFGPVDATELQNSLVSVDEDIVPGAALVTVAAPVFPNASGGMNKIVLSVDSNAFKFTNSSGQVQTYNEASSSGSHTVSTAQGTTATIVLTLPDSVNTVVYGFQLSDASDTFVISVFKADDSRTPLAKISYSVQAQGTKRDGGKITVVMGVARVRVEVTTSAVTAVSPVKTVGSVGVQVLIPSSAVCKSIEMAIPFLWFIF